jgi:hypothetical protein
MGFESTIPEVLAVKTHAFLLSLFIINPLSKAVGSDENTTAKYKEMLPLYDLGPASCQTRQSVSKRPVS